MNRKKQAVNIVGNRYGLLTVVARSDKNYRKKWPLWVCRCDCGNITEVRGNSLKTEGTKSCGCLKRECQSHRKLPPGIRGFNQLLLRYKNGARSRGLEFNLTKEDVVNLFLGNCFYCGKSPSQIVKIREYDSVFIYNGIDRIDNSGPYSIENTVSCCKECNSMKADSALKDFVIHIKQIYKNLHTKN